MKRIISENTQVLYCKILWLLETIYSMILIIDTLYVSSTFLVINGSDEEEISENDVLKCGKSAVSKVSYKLFCWCKTVKKIASLINNLSRYFLVQLPVSVLKQRNTQILISPQHWHTYLLTWFARNIIKITKKSFFKRELKLMLYNLLSFTSVSRQ